MRGAARARIRVAGIRQKKRKSKQRLPHLLRNSGRLQVVLAHHDSAAEKRDKLALLKANRAAILFVLTLSSHISVLSIF